MQYFHVQYDSYSFFFFFLTISCTIADTVEAKILRLNKGVLSC